MNKKRMIIRPIYHLTIFVLILVSIIIMFFSKNEDTMQPVGFIQFRYFTILSNSYFALNCLIYGIINIKELKDSNYKYHKIFDEVYFSSTISVMITLFTTIFFLSFIYGLIPLLKGLNFIFHLVAPILAIVGYLIFIPNRKDVKFIRHLFAFIPLTLYSILYLIMVLVIKEWPDFYGFNSGALENKWPISLIFMYLFTLLFIFSLYKIKQLIDKKKGE